MNGRTREYLEGRFGDYYRSADLVEPPAADEREWGYIPWSTGGTTMVRHQSLLDVGDLGSFLARTGPRHTYFSAARYDDPGARRMDEKEWVSADLVFDLDADHLPSVDPAETAYPEMLDACKDALVRLLDILDDDFSFADTEVVFSGGRGYHVHVRDRGVRSLDSEARREVVDYVRGIDLDVDGIVDTVSRGGTTRREMRTEGGWGKRTHEALVDFADELRDLDEEEALARLQELDGIGEGRATTILGAFERSPEAVREGNVEAGGPGLRRLVDALARRTVTNQSAPIDEPVTTDTKRLIRLPGSLHGGTGLVVKPIDEDAIDDFDPLVDAVPERFRRRRILVDVTAPGPVGVGDDSFTVDEGVNSVREYVGVFLMARGRAEKAKE